MSLTLERRRAVRPAAFVTCSQSASGGERRERPEGTKLRHGQVAGARRAHLVALPALAVAALATATANAQDSWTGAVSSDWGAAANWLDASTPGSSDSVVIDTTIPHAATVTGLEASSSVTVGDTGTGSLTLTGGLLTVGGGTGSMTLAAGAGSSGMLFVGAATHDPAGAAAPGLLNAGSLQFGAGTGSLTFNHTSTSYLFVPSITGTGAVNLRAGTTALIGNNSYVGPTTITGGTLIATQDQSLSAASDFTVAAGATLQIDDGVIAEVASLSGAGSAELGSAAGLYVVGDRATTFSGSIVGDGDFGYDGGGSLTLTGSSAIGGELSLCSCGDGSITIDGGSFSADFGTAILGGRLVVAAGGTLETFDLVVDSEMTVTGSGTRVTATGATAVGFTSGGRLTVADGGVLVSQDGAQLDAIFEEPSATVTGSGSRWQVEGPLLIGDAGFGGTAELTVADRGTVTATDRIRIGEGSRLLLGDGGRAGTINTPEIVNEGELLADFTDDAILEADISGQGSLTKAGSGTLALKGTNTYSGATRVERGRLIVDGTLASPVTVLAGAGLGGGGRLLGGLVSRGTLAPGNSIGTLSVEGDATLEAGSLYEVEVEPATGASDRIDVAGRAVLQGGRVQHVGFEGDYPSTSTYTILVADDGVAGQFGSVASDYLFLDPSLSYDATKVYLTLERNGTELIDLVETDNQAATAGHIVSLSAGVPVFDAILALTDEASVRAALDALSGELHADLSSTAIEQSRLVRDAVTARVRRALSARAPGIQQALAAADDLANTETTATGGATWGQVFGSWGRSDGDGGAASAEHATKGVLLGADLPLPEDWTLGLFTGYDRRDVEVAARGSSATVDSLHLGAYGGKRFGAFELAVGAAYAWHWNDTSRSVVFPGFNETVRADYGSATAQLFGEANYSVALDGLAIQPFAGFAYVRNDSEGFSEHGGDAALDVESNDHDLPFTTLGARVAGAIELAGLPPLTARATAGWRHAFGDTAPDGSATIAGVESFTIHGLPVARDAAVLEARVEASLGGDAVVGLGYAGQVGDGFHDHGLGLDLSVRF